MNAVRHRGFTLIELMIVVAIIGIIAAIAYPAYTSQVMKTQRSDAKTALMTDAHLLERCYTENNAYINGGACTALAANSPEEYYSITVTIPAGGASFSLEAKPIAGAVKNDTECKTFTLDNKGTQSSTPAGGSCW